MTTLKTLLVAGLLLAPGMAAAQGCNYEKTTTAQSCAPGNVLDAETGTCVPEATG
ncbi:adenylosuccinate lyase [Jannaschia sp. Os4]|uniref:adenylosuccinate lyase n=1 Tax=Jannaschia sp. Os4 TaxID=2807617 RepID=UPI001939C67F|nr:adenylosuccinate lyase [Jannaschia sp. Os4]MBM2577697.1 adenylosuccinate lyase [Jannaschia sp. Os4]